jgi:folate-binding protein YgfZ
MTTPKSFFLDFSRRAKLRITGSDRIRFLNGQITNDLRNVTDGAAIEACMLNAKGKVNAHIFVSAGRDCFFIDADPKLREVIPARLERYVIADDVQIEDITDQLSVFYVLSPIAPSLSNCRLVSARRFNESGWDVWADATAHDALLQQLSFGHSFLDPAAAEVMRIEQGLPRWGRELNEEIIPIEANLEERAISYEKGCYIGQEVISRMKMSGQTNKRLCGLISLHDTPLRASMKLATGTPAIGKETGWITSATRSERIGKEIALGYVKRGFNDVGTRLEAFAPDRADAARFPVELVRLPFV